MFIFSSFPFNLSLMEKEAIGNFCRGRFAWVGYPDDLGVKNVNGRPGAAEGPARFLEYFKRLKGRSDLTTSCVVESWLDVGGDLEQNHEFAAATTREALGRLDLQRDVLLAVGGGHDYAYPWIRAFQQALPEGTRVACLNLDAHFDLRPFEPVMTSGSPFRRLIEEGALQPGLFAEFGIQSHCNSPELFQYAEDRGMSVIPMEALRGGKAVESFRETLAFLSDHADHVLLSLDLDSLSFAYAPGVSAPQAEGFTASEVFQMLEIAGSDKKVASLGIFELAPPLDVQDLTSRLAAQAAWHFLNARIQ
jgi:formiminoglutamase/guanidinobutyrase